MSTNFTSNPNTTVISNSDFSPIPAYAAVPGAETGIVQASAPTVNHDRHAGYHTGSFIIVGTALYFCADAAPGAAVWKQLTNAS
jgi:hypothetical protein